MVTEHTRLTIVTDLAPGQSTNRGGALAQHHVGWFVTHTRPAAQVPHQGGSRRELETAALEPNWRRGAVAHVEGVCAHARCTRDDDGMLRSFFFLVLIVTLVSFCCSPPSSKHNVRRATPNP